MIEGETIEALERSVNELRMEYERYFIGAQRREPMKLRDQTKRTLRKLRTRKISNTAHRFRFQSVQARLVVLESYWNRMTRKLEGGDIRPVRQMRHRGRIRAAQSTTKMAQADQTTVTGLHEQYELARRQVGSEQPISLQSLEKIIEQRSQEIINHYRCVSIDFKIVVKKGKIVLQATPIPDHQTAGESSSFGSQSVES